MDNNGKRSRKHARDDLKRDAFDMRHNRGMSIDDIASLFNKSPRTIRRWIFCVKNQGSSDSPKRILTRNRPKVYPNVIFTRIVELKKENPNRTAVALHRFLTREFPGSCPSVSLVRKHLVSQGLNEKKPRNRTGYVKFARSMPNDLWQVDIAGVQTVGHLGKVYLHALLDDCSRFIVAACYYKDQKGINILRTLRHGFEEYGRPRQILADNGRQFRNAIGELGTKYSRLLYLMDVEPIFASPHHPQTKGKLERWFGTVIQGFLGEARFHVKEHPEITLEEFNRLFQEWLHWYNFEKPHRSLPDRTTPANVYLNHPKRINRPLETIIDWDRWILTTGTRKVSRYNAISYKKETITIPQGYMGCKVEVLEIDETIEVYYKDTCLVTHVIDLDFIRVKDKKFERKVNAYGIVKYQGETYNVGSLLGGKTVIVRETNQGNKIAIYADDILLEEFKKKNAKEN